MLYLKNWGIIAKEQIITFIPIPIPAQHPSRKWLDRSMHPAKALLAHQSLSGPKRPTARLANLPNKPRKINLTTFLRTVVKTKDGINSHRYNCDCSSVIGNRIRIVLVPEYSDRIKAHAILNIALLKQRP